MTREEAKQVMRECCEDAEEFLQPHEASRYYGLQKVHIALKLFDARTGVSGGYTRHQM